MVVRLVVFLGGIANPLLSCALQSYKALPLFYLCQNLSSAGEARGDGGVGSEGGSPEGGTYRKPCWWWS